MDISTLVGFLLGFSCLIVAIMMHGNITDFVDVPGALVTFGGASAALFITFPLQKVLGVFSVVKHCFLDRLPEPQEEVRRLAELATTARRDGLLALEKNLAEIDDPFLVRGLEMVIDGTAKEKLMEILRLEVDNIQSRHLSGKKIFEQLGYSLPAFGLVGCLVGLIQMMKSLDDPSNIGRGMAVAMVGTFYGVFTANFIAMPLAGKLDNRSREEVLLRELMIHGLVALVEGESPRALEIKLKTFLAPKHREEEAPAA